jgi:hypothetical protein
MSQPGTSHSKTPLDAAQKIVAELQGMTPEQQTLALKFSLETLGLQVSTTSIIKAPAAAFTAGPVRIDVLQHDIPVRVLP